MDVKFIDAHAHISDNSLLSTREEFLEKISETAKNWSMFSNI